MALYDLVLVSFAKNDELRKMTIQAVKTAGNRGKIIIVESNHNVSYPDVTCERVKVIYPDRKFSYNAFLNLGAKYGVAEYIFFGNNDLIFTKDWDINIIHAMEQFNSDSASPMCPKSHHKLGVKENTGVIEGYNINSRFCGWAYMWKRKLFEKAGGFDEDFTFWCSDNATVEQLLKLKKKHILVTSSIVHHLGGGSNTINVLESKVVNEYTNEEIEKYNKKYNRNLKIIDTSKVPKGIS